MKHIHFFLSSLFNLAVFSLISSEDFACKNIWCLNGYERDFAILGKQRTIQKILDTLNVPANSSDLSELINVTQQKFLRPPNTERWQIDDSYRDRKVDLMSLFEELGCVGRLQASQKHYNYALLMGGVYESCRKRINFLSEEWERGIRFDEIVILSGFRKLTDSEKQLIAIHFPGLKVPDEEFEMIQFLYDNAKLPDGLRHAKMTWINSRARPNAQRATTADTVNDWLAKKPTPGRALIISSQPFCFYQRAVAKGLLPLFNLEEIGREASDATSVGVYLDNIARWLFCEKNLLEKLAKESSYNS